MRRLDAKDEGDGVHRIRFARSIGPDNGSEVGIAKQEGVVALVRLEIVKFETYEFTHGELDAKYRLTKMQNGELEAVRLWRLEHARRAIQDVDNTIQRG